MKRIITVQDISCVGKCSLTVALPIISAMGVEACVLPTAVLSTHTAFQGFTFKDLTDQITPITEHWKKQMIHFDAIYTGYLGSFEQLELMHKLFDDFGSADTLRIVDPCMGDDGKLYSGFTQEFAFAMAGLCSKAHIITPNLTEASFMLGVPFMESGYDKAYVEDLLLKLSQLGAKKVILKGIELGGNRMGIASYDSENHKFNYYFHDKMPQSFHGTGDIFASVVTGALVQNRSFEESYKLAADFVVESIKNTLSHPDYNWYGVDFESALHLILPPSGN